MALTLATVKEGRAGDRAYWIGTATFDSSYATGGESFAPGDVGLSNFDHVDLTPDLLTSTTSLLTVFDDSANKIQLFESAADGSALAEIGNDNVSALVVSVMAFGEVGNR